MLNVGTIDRERSRWQYLFPEGLREEYPLNGKVHVTTYTRAWCEGIVDRFRQYQAASEAHGMPAQPLPVQIQHVGILGTATTSEERRRVGSIYDLAYVPRGGAIPGGVWALIEWTEEGLSLIASGKFNTISPTNTTFMTLSTGRKIKGDCLEEASLVDRPFLESIGTAADFLPFDAIPYQGRRQATPSAATRSLPPAWFAPADTGLVITRGAQYRGAVMDETTEKVEFELTPDKLTPEIIGAIMESESARAMVRKMCREYMESDMGPVLETMGYLKREAVAPPTEPGAETVDIAARAAKVENERIEGEALGLVKSGKLLAMHATEYLTRSRVGKPVDDLLKDRSAASALHGVAGTTPRETPPETAARSRKSSDVHAEALAEIIKEKGEAGAMPAVVFARMQQKVSALRASGVTVTE